MNKSYRTVFAAVLFAAGAFETVHAGSLPDSTSSYYRAAVQGHADAQAKLAALYASGAGVQQSDTAAFQWFMRAAEQGHV